MPDAALEEKFNTLTAEILPKAQAKQLLDTAWNLDKATNLDEIAKLMIKPQNA